MGGIIYEKIYEKDSCCYFECVRNVVYRFDQYICGGKCK